MKGYQVSQITSVEAAAEDIEVYISPECGNFLRSDNVSFEKIRRFVSGRQYEQDIPEDAFFGNRWSAYLMFIFDSLEARQWLKLRRSGKSSDAIYFEDGIRQPQIVNGLMPENGIEVPDDLMPLWEDLVMSIGAIVALYGYNYEALVKAAREGRFKARKSGSYWLTTMGALEGSVKAGTLRAPKGKK